ncbi:integrating conjugative element protein [Rodentibacter ratti]|uniref:Integrating conjugative element protein n=2 Tax=Rodentibacter TaxID=1960084 RepID=A0A1V3L5F6_9PAST|nr:MULTISPECIES: TIGR03761 family integrating conjugative element protein [Rodentibacter]OOF78811.1 integrating conjugative element protein [Rodentibacter heylii]OOF84830.1 integrating conjugative element protein [Rodentibacter ratti]QIA76814.1 TIGR03761 family integrating conjugative element protein [Rodentibacter heylii]
MIAENTSHEPQSTQPQMGALRSEITLTLHSQYATRMWQGRPILREGKKIVRPGILSIPGCLSLLSQLQKDAANDDPYADYYLVEFENMVLNNTEQMKKLIADLVEIHAEQLPDGIDIQRCSNIEPAIYQIYADSPLAYKLIYLLCEFDTLAKTTMTAAYIALLTKAEAREWLEAGSILLRRCFGVIETYRHSGITRQDVRDNSARYQEVRQRFKLELPQDIVEGTRRARFAPDIHPSTSDNSDVLERE